MISSYGAEVIARDYVAQGDTTDDSRFGSFDAATLFPSTVFFASLLVAAGALLVMRFILHSRPDGIGMIARHAEDIRDTIYCLAYGTCLMFFWGAVICAIFVAASLLLGSARRFRRTY